MLAIKAYYDGHVFVPLGQVKFKKNQQAMIVVEETPVTTKKTCRGIAEKYAKPELVAQEEEFIAETFSGAVQ
ncbi:MAG: DUF104 domain-containing protein [Treponema sp.]|nr:DUF104 domain-containing protein [Treponema sp.]